MLEYIRYYHEDRTHLALKKEHLRAVKLWRPLIHIVESYRLQGLAVCIIVMIWPPEPAFEKTPRSSTRDGARDVVAKPFAASLAPPSRRTEALEASAPYVGKPCRTDRSEKLIFSSLQAPDEFSRVTPDDILARDSYRQHRIARLAATAKQLGYQLTPVTA